MQYILDTDHTPIPCDDAEKWANWFEGENWRVASTRVASTRVGEAMISTIFLGIDHSFGIGPPLVFETMVFGGPLDQKMERYTSWDAAIDGHAAMLKRVIKGV